MGGLEVTAWIVTAATKTAAVVTMPAAATATND